ncbi:MAG: ABC transporter substrate-binding protein [Burkholderiaceae bacterium]|nr:ABC transporter substrate-binding protein [Burkholderiaceae bacterium]
MKQKLLRTLIASTALAAAATAVQAKEFLITSITELTGAIASQGIPLSRGMKVAADEINASSYLGADKIKLVQLDNGSDRGQSALLLKRSAADGSLAIIGTASGYNSLSITPLANELQVPLMGMVYSPDLLASGPWSLKITSSDDSHTLALARYVVNKAKPKECMIIYARDNPGFVGQYKTFREFTEKQGVKFVGVESIAMQDTDFTALATKIASMKPDCLHISTLSPAGANIIAQARAAGMSSNTKIFSSAGFANEALIKVGGAAVEGVVVVADYAPGGVNEEGKKFEATFMKAYGVAPENWAAVGYAQMKLIASVIKKIGPNVTRESLREGLSGVKNWPNILGANGIMTITDRLPEYDAAVMTVKNGKFVNAQ